MKPQPHRGATCCRHSCFLIFVGCHVIYNHGLGKGTPGTQALGGYDVKNPFCCPTGALKILQVSARKPFWAMYGDGTQHVGCWVLVNTRVLEVLRSELIQVMDKDTKYERWREVFQASKHRD